MEPSGFSTCRRSMTLRTRRRSTFFWSIQISSLEVMATRMLALASVMVVLVEGRSIWTPVCLTKLALMAKKINRMKTMSVSGIRFNASLALVCSSECFLSGSAISSTVVQADAEFLSLVHGTVFWIVGEMDAGQGGQQTGHGGDQCLGDPGSHTPGVSSSKEGHDLEDLDHAVDRTQQTHQRQFHSHGVDDEQAVLGLLGEEIDQSLQQSLPSVVIIRAVLLPAHHQFSLAVLCLKPEEVMMLEDQQPHDRVDSSVITQRRPLPKLKSSMRSSVSRNQVMSQGPQHRWPVDRLPVFQQQPQLFGPACPHRSHHHLGWSQDRFW